MAKKLNSAQAQAKKARRNQDSGVSAASAAGGNSDSGKHSNSRREHRHQKQVKHSSLDEFKLQLSLLRLRIRSIASDGNCMFAAIADQLYGDVSRHSEIRAAAVAFLLLHSDEFSLFCEDGSAAFPAYCRRMAKAAVWGDYMCQNAITRHYNINIVVHQLNAPRMEVRNVQQEATAATTTTTTVHISYHDQEHYASVRNMNDDITQPATAINITTAAAAAAAAIAAGHSSSSASAGIVLTLSEQIVMQSTGITDIDAVREALADCWNDADVAVEMLLAAEQQQQELQVAQIEAEDIAVAHEESEVAAATAAVAVPSIESPAAAVDAVHEAVLVSSKVAAATTVVATVAAAAAIVRVRRRDVKAAKKQSRALRRHEKHAIDDRLSVDAAAAAAVIDVDRFGSITI